MARLRKKKARSGNGNSRQIKMSEILLFPEDDSQFIENHHVLRFIWKSETNFRLFFKIYFHKFIYKYLLMSPFVRGHNYWVFKSRGLWLFSYFFIGHKPRKNDLNVFKKNWLGIPRGPDGFSFFKHETIVCNLGCHPSFFFFFWKYFKAIIVLKKFKLYRGLGESIGEYFYSSFFCKNIKKNFRKL